MCFPAICSAQDQNRYRPSTILDKVALVKRAFESTKDWSKARKALLEILGDHKASTVHRWIVLARDMDAPVLEWIEANQPTLSQSFVIGNKYVTGRGSMGGLLGHGFDAGPRSLKRREEGRGAGADLGGGDIAIS